VIEFHLKPPFLSSSLSIDFTTIGVFRIVPSHSIIHYCRVTAFSANQLGVTVHESYEMTSGRCIPGTMVQQFVVEQAQAAAAS
jgi:hypothetical protein